MLTRLSSLQKIGALVIVMLSVGASLRFFGGRLGPNSVTAAGKIVGSAAPAVRTLSSQLTMSAKSQAETAIAKNTVMVFSKSYCPYCTRAKEALTNLKVKFEAIELDNVKDGADIQAALQEMTGQRTVPNIFVKGQHVGGCDATLAKIADGSFQKMLA